MTHTGLIFSINNFDKMAVGLSGPPVRFDIAFVSSAVWLQAKK